MLIEPTTTALTRKLKMNKGDVLQVYGILNAGEVIVIEIPDGSSGWKALAYDVNGDGTPINIELTSANSQLVFEGPSYIRINKTATANPVGIERIRS